MIISLPFECAVALKAVTWRSSRAFAGVLQISASSWMILIFLGVLGWTVYYLVPTLRLSGLSYPSSQLRAACPALQKRQNSRPGCYSSAD